jgi:hypothetical protein
MIFAKQAKLPDGWAKNVRLIVASGRITTIDVGQKSVASDVAVDTILPALANLHSHSFQRAMAGMTEFRKAEKDSFWTWRDLMYQFTANLACKRPGASPTCALMPRPRRSTSRSASSRVPSSLARPAARPISQSTTHGRGTGSIFASSSIRRLSTPPFPALLARSAARPDKSQFLGRAAAAASASCSMPS